MDGVKLVKVFSKNLGRRKGNKTITAYEVLVEGELVGYVYSKAAASNRLCINRRLVLGTSYPLRWGFKATPQRTDYDISEFSFSNQVFHGTRKAALEDLLDYARA